jgi:hypothetical protein
MKSRTRALNHCRPANRTAEWGKEEEILESILWWMLCFSQASAVLKSFSVLNETLDFLK